MFILLSSFIIFVGAGDPWMHSVHLFGSKNNQSSVINQQQTSILYDHVQRKIVLEDSRTITCNIPLDPTFAITKDIFKSKLDNVILHQAISLSTSLQILHPLKDLCAYHFTYEFVWEYCFKKYVRQYDDFQTVRNVQKNQYEEFFIGYSAFYNTTGNSTIGLDLAPLHHIQIKLQENQTLQNIIFDENVTKSTTQNNQMIDVDLTNKSIEEGLSLYLLPDKELKHLYGFSFKLRGLTNQSLYQLQIKLAFESDQINDLEILFLSEPTPQIYVREYGTKGLYTRMDRRFCNQTLQNRAYWVIVDLEQMELMLGQGSNLSLNTLMLRYKIRGLPQSSLKNFTAQFLPFLSRGTKVLQIGNLDLTEYRSSTLPENEKVDGPQYTSLNFSGYSFIERENITQNVRIQHTEDYQEGSFCPAVNAPRRIKVTMVCSKHSLLEIIKITEPNICVYRMEVGTYLLCDPDELSVETAQASDSVNGQMMICTIDE